MKIIILLAMFFGTIGYAFEPILLQEEDERIVAEAKNHLRIERSLRNRASHPRNGKKWENCLNSMQSDIDNISLATEAILYAQFPNYINFDHRDFVDLREQGVNKDFLYMKYPVFSSTIQTLSCDVENFKRMQDHETALKNEFPHFAGYISSIDDSQYSIKETMLDYNGRLVSNVFYYHLRYLFKCLTYIKPKTVCEIGGGYGGPARLWMANPIFIPNTYILVDFPECLFFAECFLKANFRNSINICYINELPDDLVSLDFPQKTIILCPIGHEDFLSPFQIDLAINTGSLQEMPENWVDHWMSWLDKSNIQHFYSLNYLLRPIGRRSVECETVFAPRLSPKWQCIVRQATYPFWPAVAYVLFGEILAEKKEESINFPLLVSEYNKIHKPLNSQGALDCLDIVRLTQDQYLAWDLIHRFLTDIYPAPQETLYLIQMLKNKASPSFLLDKIEWLDLNEESIINELGRD